MPAPAGNVRSINDGAWEVCLSWRAVWLDEEVCCLLYREPGPELRNPAPSRGRA